MCDLDRLIQNPARFWDKVDRRGPEECWPWTASTTEKGYGKIGVGSPPRHLLSTHRMSWILAYGPIPPGMHVLHRCDVPGCVNPSHLFLGTQADNIADREAKGRGPVGERNGVSKLTEADVLEIRARLQQGEYQSEIGKDFLVAQTTISAIARGVTWKHL